LKKIATKEYIANLISVKNVKPMKKVYIFKAMWYTKNRNGTDIV